MGTLSEPKIVIDKDTYYIEARKLDIVQAMEKLLNTTRKFTIDLVKDTYPGPAIVAEVFPEIWSILESDIDYSGYYTDDTSNTEKLKSHVNKKNVWVRLSTDELRPKKGFGSLLAPDQQMFFGMLVKDPNIFKPSSDRETKAYSQENMFGAKVRIRRELEDKFIEFLGNVAQKRYWVPLTNKWNRTFRGYVEPDFAQGDDIVINGWKGYGLRPYQAEAVRKMTFQKQGLLAFDVGLGKTLTGIAAIALAKQQGWCQRPLIIVPNSILFKWKADILKALPDWKIVTIGANQFYDNNGNLKSKVDTPEERGENGYSFLSGPMMLHFSLIRCWIEPNSEKEHMVTFR